MSNFYADVITRSPYFNEVLRVQDMELLEPVTRDAVRAIMADSAAAGMPLLCFETYRSEARQQALFTQKATTLRTVGVHHYGLACDLVKSIRGAPSWKGDFTFLSILAKKHGLISGADWGQPGMRHSFVDADHVQRIALSDEAKLFDGSWYPDPGYVAQSVG